MLGNAEIMKLGTALIALGLCSVDFSRKIPFMYGEGYPSGIELSYKPSFSSTTGELVPFSLCKLIINSYYFNNYVSFLYRSLGT
jgi:hypothetical protein